MVPDPGLVRRRLLAAGARAGFSGMMVDARYDRRGELVARDEVLRLRVFHHADGRRDAILGWKGATGLSTEGYKMRRELGKMSTQLQELFPRFAFKQKVVEEMIVVAGNVHEKFKASWRLIEEMEALRTSTERRAAIESERGKIRTLEQYPPPVRVVIPGIEHAVTPDTYHPGQRAQRLREAS